MENSPAARHGTGQFHRLCVFFSAFPRVCAQNKENSSQLARLVFRVSPFFCYPLARDGVGNWPPFPRPVFALCVSWRASDSRRFQSNVCVLKLDNFEHSRRGRPDDDDDGDGDCDYAVERPVPLFLTHHCALPVPFSLAKRSSLLLDDRWLSAVNFSALPSLPYRRQPLFSVK